MNILVLNGGSSSHKISLYLLETVLPSEPPEPTWEAQLDWYPEQNYVVINIKGQGQAQQRHRPLTDQKTILTSVVQALWHGPMAVLSAPAELDGVGHRVVHGGENYTQSVVITSAVKATIAQLSSWAPIHNPINLNGIEWMEQLLPGIPQVAVFDTAFHRQMPTVATCYPGPYHWLEQGIRRYGFHGISHRYCTQRIAQLLGQSIPERLVICHLGNGGSLTAVKGGRSIDTTMGFTPLDGLMMGTRSGTVDPGILLHLMRQGYDADEIDHLLNHASGLKGISGISHDFREINSAIAQGHPRATLARNLYQHRLKACLGSMIMSLEGLDGLVFTAGIGEHSHELRTEICQSLTFLGVEIDIQKNCTATATGLDQDIATPNSTARVWVIHTQEDWAIAQDCWQCLREVED